MVVKGKHYVFSVGEVGSSHHLAAGMHRQLRHTTIDHTHSGIGTNPGSDGRPAGTVVAHNNFVDRNIGDASQFPHHKPGDSARSVSLVGIGLDDKTPVELRCVVRFVLRGVVGMDRVDHVDAQNEGLADAGAVKVRIGRAAPGEGRRNPLDGFGHDGRTRSLRRRRSDLFVVEEDGHRDVGRFVVQTLSIGTGVIDQGFQRSKDRGEVVETGSVDEFFGDPAQRRRLRVVQTELEVDDLIDADVQLFGDRLQQQGFLGFLPLVDLVVGFLFQNVLCCFVGLRSDPPARGNDRGRVILLVDGKSLPFFGRLVMDAQGADPGDRIFEVYQFLFRLEGATTAVFGLAARPWFLHQNAPAHGQIAVEPRVPQTAPVTLDSQQGASRGRSLGSRLHP
mmetsp:Transcript_28655/g.61463  ORF Transcript_28655/g.61463 Transcript_28655/m.61463 type:complete len:392 (-) Transcript_28655:500-1675(-)